MTDENLVAELDRNGVSLIANGDQLQVSAPTGVMTPALREMITMHKQELLSALRFQATAVLAEAGVRIPTLNGVFTVLIRADRDCPEVRAALRVFGSDSAPMRYLDDAQIPAKYKTRLAGIADAD